VAASRGRTALKIDAKPLWFDIFVEGNVVSRVDNRRHRVGLRTDQRVADQVADLVDRIRLQGPKHHRSRSSIHAIDVHSVAGGKRIGK